MADPTNPGQPSDDATSRGNPINVNEATVGNVSVTRMNVNTGEIKELQADLLKKLCDCVDEQTNTLGQIIREAKKETVDAIKKGGGGGGGGGGRGGSGGDRSPGQGDSTKSLADAISSLEKSLVSKQAGGEEAQAGSLASARAAQRAWAVLNDEIEDGVERKIRPAFEQFGKFVKEGVLTRFERNMRSIDQSVFDFGESLMDVQAGLRKAMAEVDDIFKMGQGGMIEVTTLFEDLGAGILQNRDAMLEAAKTVRAFAEQGELVIGQLGSNIEEVASTFKRNRAAIDEAFGDEFLGRIPFEEQNVILTEILQQSRRRGIMASNEDILQSQQTRDQIELLREIAFATGKTVEEIIKQQDKDVMNLEMLRKTGRITESQLKVMQQQETRFSQTGQEDVSQFFNRIAELGGTTQARTDQDFSFLMSRGNNEALIRQAYKIYQTDPSAAGADAINKLLGSLEGLEGMGTEAAAELIKKFPGLEKAMTMSIKAQQQYTAAIAPGGGGGFQGIERGKEAAKGTVGAAIQETYNDVKEFMRNNFGAGGDLALALGLNTAAVIANTFAHGGGSIMRALGGGFMKLIRKIPGFKGKGAFEKLKGVGDNFLKGRNSGLRGATTSAGASAARGAAGAGSLISTAAAGIIGVAIAGAVGYAIGTMLSKGIDWMIQKFTGDPNASLGTTDAAKTFFDAIPGLRHVADPEMAKKAEIESQRLLAAAEERKKMLDAENAKRTAQGLDPLTMSQFRNKGVAPQKGVSPQTANDPAAVSPSDVAQGMPPVTVIAGDVAASELGKHTVLMEQMVKLLTDGNAKTDTLISKSGPGMGSSEQGAPRPSGAVKGKSNAPEPYSPLLNESPPSAIEGVFTS